MRLGRTTTSRPARTRCLLRRTPPTLPRRTMWLTPPSSTVVGSTGTPTSSRGLTTRHRERFSIPPTMRAAAASPTTPTPRTTRCSRTSPPPPTACARRAGTTLLAPICSCAAATWVSQPLSKPSPSLPSVLRPRTMPPPRLPAHPRRTTCLPSTLAPSVPLRRRVTCAARCSRERPARILVACGSLSSRRAPRRMLRPSRRLLGTSLLAFELKQGHP
mmetsp:Transcript_2806/g.6725  ORF Transcript_2806/g.6725 Transcript_2806/m.6725 type:complete len:217 (+) Transcript_2806:220-870(+)